MSEARVSHDWNIVDDEELLTPAEPSDALDGRRIHAIVLERRATHRARLRAVLVPIACAAVALSAAGQAWAMRATRPGCTAACLAIAIATAWVGVRTIRSRRDAVLETTSAPEDGPTSPDFSGLAESENAANRLSRLIDERRGR